MSARQRFVAHGKPANQAGDADGIEASAVSETQIPPVKHDPPVLKDASNSPRPGRRAMHGNTHNNKIMTDMDTTGSATQTSSAALSMACIDKPLNISSLSRPKSKRAGDMPGQNKKDRNPAVDRLKENEPLSRLRSPRAYPLSPSRRLQNAGPPTPHLFGSSNATLLTDDQDIAPPSRQGQSLRLSGSSTTGTPGDIQRHSRVPLTGNSFTASGHALMNAFSPSTSRSYNESLDPARREIFPLRMAFDGSTEQTHTFDSLSPPSPAQRRFSEERAYDYQAPVNLAEPGGDADEPYKDNQHILRRTTKRIIQHETEDEVANVRDGKRAKIDMQSNEQLIDLTYENRGRPSRASTPTHRHRTPTQIDTYQSHQPQPAKNVPQFGEDNQALCHLIGLDLERYLSEHIAQYETAKKRWTGCSIEEWQAGADEMSGKFSKLVDFVKDHMATKLTLYASLHSKVAEHKVILGERRSMLKSTQEKLVKDSGTVLGGNASGAP